MSNVRIHLDMPGNVRATRVMKMLADLAREEGCRLTRQETEYGPTYRLTPLYQPSPKGESHVR